MLNPQQRQFIIQRGTRKQLAELGSPCSWSETDVVWFLHRPDITAEDIRLLLTYPSKRVQLTIIRVNTHYLGPSMFVSGMTRWIRRQNPLLPELPKDYPDDD